MRCFFVIRVPCFYVFFNTSSDSGLLASVFTESSLFAPFPVGKYILEYKGFLDNRRFTSLSIDGQYWIVCESCFGAKRVIAAGACIKRWINRNGRGAAMHIDSVAVPLDTPFICCTEVLPFVSRLVTNIARYTDIRDEDITCITWIMFFCASTWMTSFANAFRI